MKNENLIEIIDLILKHIDKFPSRLKESIKKELMIIKELVVDTRSPKTMIIGRRGAGKSSLVNAIFGNKVAAVGSVLSETGKPQWHEYAEKRGTLRILDTRGLGDNTKPESANFEDAFQEIMDAIKDECPDIILFLCKAKEVDSRISEDIQNVVHIKNEISKIHKYEIPIISAITQVDELDPKRIEPPYDNEIKRKNIEDSTMAMSRSFSSNGIDLLKTVPVSAYAEYENEELVYNNYWNIDTLVEYLIEALPDEAQLEMARISRLAKIQKKAARKLVASTATVCAGIAATPIPVADILPITAAQTGMIIGIGYIAGKPLSKETAKEFIAALGVNVGTGFVLREIARATVKFVFPGAGNAISAGVAAAGTWAIGEAAIAYFIDNKPIEEVKDIGNKARKKHSNDIQQ